MKDCWHLGVWEGMRAGAARALLRARVGCALVGIGLAGSGMLTARAEDSKVLVHSRVVHVFDFTEPQNLEPEPMHWVRFPDSSLPEYPDPAFPRYTSGFRDDGVGHESAPSFYLQADGRNVAYRYKGVDTRVTPGEYLVMGWIRPHDLEHGRAAISAYYLDWQRRPIHGSQRFSELVGSSTDSPDDWAPVRIHMPAAPLEAQAIGLTCWVVQEEVWTGGKLPHRHILHREARSGAWFDDITVYGLPRVSLGTTRAGNVFELPARPVLLATVADESAEGLSARLTVRDLDHAVIYETRVAVRAYSESAGPERIALPELLPGLFKAELEVFSREESILREPIRFAVLHKSLRAAGTVVRHMGVTLGGPRGEDFADRFALVETLGVGRAKLVIWSDDPLQPGFDRSGPGLHEWLDQLVQTRLSIVGVFAGPPSRLGGSADEYAPTLLDILGGDPAIWRRDLQDVAAPYVSVFESWQVGGDGRVAHDRRLPRALAAVGSEMAQLTTLANLTVAASAADEPADRMSAQNVAVDVPPDIQPEFVADHLRAYQSLGYDQLWCSIPLPADGGDRTLALADWAKRIIEARYARVDAVFVPELWHSAAKVSGRVTEPSLAYVAYRTLVDALGDATPADRFKLDDHTEVVAFSDGSRSVLAMWDDAAGDNGAVHVLQLGSASRAIDLWGRDVSIDWTPDGRHAIRLTRLPVFVVGVEDWVVAFRSQVGLSPRRVNFTYETRRHEIELRNPALTPIAGEMVVRAPDGWELSPRVFRFGLAAGQTGRFPVEVRHPQNESAGEKILNATVTLLSEPNYRFDVPLTIELGLSDVEVWGYAVEQGDQLIVRHGVTNRSKERLSFRGFASYPGLPRQYRVFNEILPEQTLTTEYRFQNVPGDAGRRIRLGLREAGGPRVHNLDIGVN